MASADLGEGQAFELPPDPSAPEGTTLFLIRWQGQVYAYTNACPHLRVPLNWRPNGFWNLNHSALICAMHGALFEPATGLCTHGPCYGRSLEAHPVIESDGAIWLPPKG